MKKKAITALIFWFLNASGSIFAMEKLSDTELRRIHAQSGFSVAVDKVPLFANTDSFQFTAVDNMDIFGFPSPHEGYVAFESSELFTELDGVFQVNLGTYYAPDEHLLATDIAKKNGVGPNKYEHWYVGERLALTAPELQSDPYYYRISDDVARPLDGKIIALQTTMSNMTSSFTSTSGIRFCDKDLSDMSLSGITMPEFIYDGEALPGKAMTVFPGPTTGISAEIRTRLTIDEFCLHRPGYSASPDFRVSGIHLGERFSQVLPSHVRDTGDTSGGHGIDTSGWGSDFSAHMHRGYFLLGNLNQIDYADNINKDELCYHLGHTNNEEDGAFNHDPVPLVANPLSINFVNKDDRSYISLSTGLDGAIRIESSQGWNGSEFGPLAVDGIRIKHCVIEFPGGYKRSDGSFKGRVHPDQLEWLNNL